MHFLNTSELLIFIKKKYVLLFKSEKQIIYFSLLRTKNYYTTLGYNNKSPTPKYISINSTKNGFLCISKDQDMSFLKGWVVVIIIYNKTSRSCESNFTKPHRSSNFFTSFKYLNFQISRKCFSPPLLHNQRTRIRSLKSDKTPCFTGGTCMSSSASQSRAQNGDQRWAGRVISWLLDLGRWDSSYKTTLLRILRTNSFLV